MSTLNLADPNLPDDGQTVIVNADHIKERVVVPGQRIVWWLTGWERGPILIADRISLLLFDLDKRVLHTISTKNTETPIYVMHQIFNVFTEGGKVGADIHFSPQQAIQPVSSVPGERWLEVLSLARCYAPIHNRLLGMRD